MTSHGDDDDGESSRPAPAPPSVVYDDLVEVHEHARMLQSVLQSSSPRVASHAGELVKGMMDKLSNAMSVLGNTGGVAPSSSGAGKALGGRRKRPAGAAASAGPHRRSSSRRRTKSPFINMVTARTLDDGKSWRKYGQKKIHYSSNPRSYYRCTHKPDQGCMATRQVQKSESNPSELEISYYGQHTCRDPSMFASSIVQGAVSATAPSDGGNLISFAPINGIAASTSTSSFPHRFVKETMDHRMLFSRFSSYSSSPAPPEGALSGLPSQACYEKFKQYTGGQLADVLGRTTSAFTVGSAPAEYWPVVEIAGVDMDAGAGIDSFPSSPSSPGFMSGSLESFGGNNLGGDDLFGFDS